MKAVLQRVTEASVSVNGKIIGKISNGFLALLGVVEGDTEKEADILAAKILNLRVFSDEQGKMNLSALDVGGEILLVSQFTLCADCRHGRRPSFTSSAEPVEAKRLYEYVEKKLKDGGARSVETGEFGADMQVRLTNDGPVTIILNTDELR